MGTFLIRLDVWFQKSFKIHQCSRFQVKQKIHLDLYFVKNVHVQEYA
jgi:hypothetical protein